MASRTFEVLLTADAEADLDDLVKFVEIQQSTAHADHVFSKLKAAILALGTAPKRGRVVPELREVGVSNYREILWKPYRVLYLVEDKRVYVVAILDGHRDLADLLLQRLLR